MHRCLALLAAVFMAACSTAPRAERDGDRPNIVLIFADDMGYGDVGCFGQTRWRTPNLDRLAAGGVRLTDFYAAQGVCSASRAGLLTGCYPNRLHVAGALGPRSATGLNPSERTLAELCRSRGYATAIFGKWHLGDAPSMLPTRQGFDEWCGIPYSNDMWPRHPDLVKLPPDSGARKKGYPPLPLYEGERIAKAEVTPEDQAGFTRLFTERACAFIDRNAGRPFFLYVPHPMPHVPLFASPEYLGRSGAGLYGDVIEEIDWSVGRIVETLERHGLRERTLVIFTSDNGPWLSYGDHAGTTGGLREGKGTSWEGGVREPFIASWPGRIAPGRVERAPAMTIDLFPTVAGLIGATHDAVDGVDLWPMLSRGDIGALRSRALAFYYNANDLEAVRRGKWKLILPHSYRTLAGAPGAGGVPGTYRQARAGLELYDLEADPSETMDLAAKRQEIVNELTPVVEGFRSDLGDALTKREGAHRREAGRSELPTTPGG